VTVWRDEVEREALHDWLENRPDPELPDGFETSDVPGVYRENRHSGELMRELKQAMQQIRREG